MNYLFPLSVGHICQQSDMGNPGIVYQYIQAAAGCVDLAEDMRYVCGAANVAGKQFAGTRGGSFDFFLYILQRIHTVSAVQEDMPSFGSEFQSNAFSDSSGGTGDKNIFLRHKKLLSFYENCYCLLYMGIVDI